MKNPITPEGAASAQNPLPPVPTTKILAISHFMGTPMTPAQRAQIMRGRAVEYMASSSSEHFVPTDAIVWAESQPGSKVRLSFPSAHVQSDLAYHRLRDEHIHAIDARQIHSGDAL